MIDRIAAGAAHVTGSSSVRRRRARPVWSSPQRCRLALGGAPAGRPPIDLSFDVIAVERESDLVELCCGYWASRSATWHGRPASEALAISS
jgi:hypothetical protein